MERTKSVNPPVTTMFNHVYQPPDDRLFGMLGTGYRNTGYAASLAEFGTPRYLRHSGAWVLERPIRGTHFKDAMGCYPLFTCADWDALGRDLDEMRPNLVSFGCVLDPFGGYHQDDLERWFDVCNPYKQHFVIDLSLQAKGFTSSRHRKRARQALRDLTIEVCEEPAKHLDEWVRLYDHLIERHHIHGIGAFSRESFQKQLELPGAVLLRVLYQGQAVGGDLYMVHGDVAYAHLVGFSPGGYEMGGAYAVKWAAIEHFTGRVRWIDLGGVPGVSAAESSGLGMFKAGWSSGTRAAHFCGAILNPEAYAAISASSLPGPEGYFPAYRRGEFK